MAERLPMNDMMSGAWRAMRRPFFALVLGIALLVAIAPGPAQSATDSINVYVTPGTSHDGSTTSPFKEALLSYLGTATSTIDIAVWSLADNDVIAKLNSMANAGVTVRVITDDINYPVSGLSGSIQARRDADGGGQEMHNKFAIVDGGAVWTGSANFSQFSLTSQNNNALVIHHAGVAAAFKTEFEQMWAGKFHEAKVSSGSINFSVNGIPVEVRFSPQDRPLTRLQTLSSAAASSLYFAIYTFGDDDLANIFVSKKTLSHLGIMDNKGLEFGGVTPPIDILTAGGFNILKLGSPPTVQVHHKFVVIDGITVATGSMNFTTKGNEVNDENHVIIHNTAIADSYLAEIARLSGQTTSSVTTASSSTPDDLKTYPNPFRPGQGSMTISSGSSTVIRGARIYALDGRLVASLPGRNTASITWDGRNIRGELLGSGTYYIEITPATGKPVRRVFTLVR